MGKLLCKICGSEWHYQTFCPYKKNKRPKQQSDKELEYQEWKEQVARPAVIERDGNHCQCCLRPAYEEEKLDLDHKDGKGSHPKDKRNIKKLQLLCRFPCHRNKTDNKPCPH